MNGNRICYVTNIAAHYRSAIYLLMDKTFEIDFLFGDHPSDKRFDVSRLHQPVKVFQNNYLGKGFSYQKGVPLLFRKYDTILITGDTRCISTWLLLLFAYPFSQKKVYLWSHGWYGKESKVETIMKKLFFGLASGTFVYGDRAKRLMIEHGLNGNQIWPIHNSLDYETQVEVRKQLKETNIFQDKFRNGNRNIIFIGRLTPVKKLGLLIDALSICKDQGHYFNLTLIGDGSMKKQLKEQVEQKGLNNNVWFYGACHNEFINGELIYNADVCVSPGNVGLTAIHSMTFGTPVITNDDYSHQMPEFETIIEGTTGDFFEHDNPNALAECIIQWFETQKNRQDIRQSCYDVIEKGWTPSYQIEILRKHLK